MRREDLLERAEAHRRRHKGRERVHREEERKGEEGIN